MDTRWGLVRKEMSLYESGGLFFIKKVYGPWFWIQWAYSYSFLFLGFFLILRSHIKAKAGLAKLTLIFLAVFFPWAGNAVYISGWPFYTPVDLTSLGFVFSSVLFTLLFTQFEYLNIIPEATKLFLQANPEPF